VRLTIVATTLSKASRRTTAIAMPIWRASARRSSGSLLVRMEMKIRLSMPRTISSSASVTNASQICGSASSAALR
jgi:hypothetical protein